MPTVWRLERLPPMLPMGKGVSVRPPAAVLSRLAATPAMMLAEVAAEIGQSSRTADLAIGRC